MDGVAKSRMRGSRGSLLFLFATKPEVHVQPSPGLVFWENKYSAQPPVLIF